MTNEFNGECNEATATKMVNLICGPDFKPVQVFLPPAEYRLCGLRSDGGIIATAFVRDTECPGLTKIEPAQFSQLKRV